MKQNLLQLFSSITFTQHFWYCCPKEEPRGCSVTCNTFIISQSEQTGSYRVISWVSLKRQNTPGHKEQQMWPCPPRLDCWGAQRPSRELCSHTANKACSQNFPRHTELPLWEQTPPTHIPSTERDWGWTGALRSTRKNKAAPTNQCSQADPSPQSPSRPCGCFMPSRPGSANPSSAGSDRALPVPSMAPGTWVTQQLTARGPPTLLPAHLLLKDYFKLTQVYFQITLFSMT